LRELMFSPPLSAFTRTDSQVITPSKLLLKVSPPPALPSAFRLLSIFAVFPSDGFPPTMVRLRICLTQFRSRGFLLGQEEPFLLAFGHSVLRLLDPEFLLSWQTCISRFSSLTHFFPRLLPCFPNSDWRHLLRARFFLFHL